MDLKDPDQISLLESLLFGTFAGMGGLLAYVMRSLDAGEKPKWLNLIVEGLASAFVGMVALLACKAMGLDWRWSGVIVGLFGWMGAKASIVVISKIVHSKLGIGTDASKHDKK